MNALRMVWIISRYYSDDMRMGALFKRIGQEIGDRVEAAMDVKVSLTPTGSAPVQHVQFANNSLPESGHVIMQRLACSCVVPSLLETKWGWFGTKYSQGVLSDRCCRPWCSDTTSQTLTDQWW